jgi:hypothetical protein
MKRQRNSVGSAALLGIALLLAPSCGAGSEVELEASGRTGSDAIFAKVGADSEQRFGSGQLKEQHGPNDGHNHPAKSPFTWTTPEGWVELEPAQFREVNMQPAGDAELQCYMTILGGTGGGLPANINRWRSQLGLEELGAEAFLDLPTTGLLGGIATVVELEGSFAGMDGTPQPGSTLLGMILMTPEFTVTLKMTGPTEKIAAEKENYEVFSASLRISVQEPAPEAAPEPAVTLQPEGSGGGLTFAIPDGWTDVGAKSMRLINLMATENTQCYVIILNGEAGGLVGNLNRWRGEVGLEPIDEAGAKDLPTLTMLGRESNILEVSGDYQGMGGAGAEDQTLLGVCWIDAEASMFVKMVGPATEVAEQKDNFISFVTSLQN